MTPTQALTTCFVIETGDNDASSPSGRAKNVSLQTGAESSQGFRIGEMHLMIRYEESSELSEMTVIHRLPNAPSWFCGMANLRGKLTPVFDLARFIGVAPGPEAKRMLLVLAHGNDAAGIVIDGLPQRLRWVADERNDVGAAPERLLPHLRGTHFIEGKLWFDLNTNSLLGEIEQSIGLL